ncbi:MAG: amidohydrolase family protein, partial [Candidatus Electryoneaceae bacterium]|nr:amidohydrolase family protein [Candidatus Electryoneaceae bacterium]
MKENRSLSLENWQERISASRGDRQADWLITGGKVVNVFNGKIEELSVAIFDGYVIGFGDYVAERTLDLKGAYLAPAFIDGHIHIESSKLTPPRFTQTVVPHGTTAVIADPHEIANVWGIEGIEYMIRSSRGLPLDFRFMLPSCVPSTFMETSGAKLSAEDLSPLLDDPDILGIGEVMNFPGAYFGDSSVLAKIALSGGHRPVDGHAPGLTGRNLSAYLVAGPSTDHECTTFEEAAEKLAQGMRIMIREGSTARNLEALLPLVTSVTERRCMFVSDDRRPGDLIKRGHLDDIIRQAVKAGLDPITAIRMVTLNPAEAFGLIGYGGIRPGWRANMVALNNLDDLEVTMVWKNGRIVARDGQYTEDMPDIEPIPHSGPLPIPIFREDDFIVSDHGSAVRVIGIVPNQIVTKSLSATLPTLEGKLMTDVGHDILKLVVVERYSGNGGRGIGFVQGIGLQRGALASTVAHD